MGRAYCPTRTDASVDDDARAMEAINYPISICCVAVDRCSRASLGVSAKLKSRELISHCLISIEAERDWTLTSWRIINCSRFSDGLTVCGNNDGMTRVAIMFTDNPYFLSLSMIR